MIDCHAHVLPGSYLELVRERAETDDTLRPTLDWYGGGFERRMPASCTRYFFGSLSERIETMDSAGITSQLVSPATILTFAEESTSRVELTSAWNDAVSNEAARSDGRFRVLFGVPLPDVHAAIAETRRMLALDTTAGVSINTHINGVSLTDPRWFELFELWNDAELTVFVHPSDFRIPKFFNPFLSKDLGTQIEDTLAVTDLYESDVQTRFPKISWVVAHLGGVLSFLLGRFDEHWDRDREHRTLAEFPSHSLDGLYFDTAGHDADAIAFALMKMGHDKFVFGSDFPMVASDEYPALVERVRHAVGASHVDAIFDRNPRKLFRV